LNLEQKAKTICEIYGVCWDGENKVPNDKCNTCDLGQRKYLLVEDAQKEIEAKSEEYAKLTVALSYERAELQSRLEQAQKATVFVRHIERHLRKMEEEQELYHTLVVICKICGKTIDEIFDEDKELFVVLEEDKEPKWKPECPQHGAMNKVSKHGMWRCLECHIGYDEETKTWLKDSTEGFRRKK